MTSTPITTLAAALAFFREPDVAGETGVCVTYEGDVPVEVVLREFTGRTVRFTPERTIEVAEACR